MFFKHLQQMQDIAKQVRDTNRRNVVSHIRQTLKLLKYQRNPPIGLSDSSGWGVSSQTFFREGNRKKLLKRDKLSLIEINCILFSNTLTDESFMFPDSSLSM